MNQTHYKHYIYYIIFHLQHQINHQRLFINVDYDAALNPVNYYRETHIYPAFTDFILIKQTLNKIFSFLSRFWPDFITV